MSIIKPKRSNTSSSVPTTSDLVDGELAVNTADQKIYIRAGGSIVTIGDVAAASAGISNIVEDTTPQLGGNLDLNGNNITGTGNINITGTFTGTLDSTVTTTTQSTGDNTTKVATTAFVQQEIDALKALLYAYEQ